MTTFVYASSQGQHTHTARTKIVATFVYASCQGQRTHSARTKIMVTFQCNFRKLFSTSINVFLYFSNFIRKLHLIRYKFIISRFQHNLPVRMSYREVIFLIYLCMGRLIKHGLENRREAKRSRRNERRQRVMLNELLNFPWWLTFLQHY